MTIYHDLCLEILGPIMSTSRIWAKPNVTPCFPRLVLWTGVQNGGMKRNGKGMVHSKGECIFLYWYMKASGYLSDVLHRYDRNTEKASPGRKSSAQLRFQGIDSMAGKLRQQELNNQEISIQGGMNSFCWLVVFILYNTIQDPLPREQQHPQWADLSPSINAIKIIPHRHT